MKKDNVRSTLCYVASVLFYVAAILNFINSDSSMGVVWLALGSAFLCFGSVHQNAAKKDRDSKPD